MEISKRKVWIQELKGVEIQSHPESEGEYLLILNDKEFIIGVDDKIYVEFKDMEDFKEKRKIIKDMTDKDAIQEIAESVKKVRYEYDVYYGDKFSPISTIISKLV